MIARFLGRTPVLLASGDYFRDQWATGLLAIGALCLVWVLGVGTLLAVLGLFARRRRARTFADRIPPRATAVLGRRLMAAVADWTIVYAFTGVLIAGVVLVLLPLGDHGRALLLPVFCVVFPLIFLGPPVLMLVAYPCRHAGQSPGKRLLGVRVVGIDGGPVNAGQYWGRLVLLLSVDGALSFLIGLVVMGSTTWRQRVGDLAAGTVVVRR